MAEWSAQGPWLSSEPPMTPLGHLRRLGDVRATSDLPPRAARLDPLINCGTDQNEPSFTLVLVESGSVPKAIEFVPADVPRARPKLVETIEIGRTLGRRQVRYEFEGPFIHADQNSKIAFIFQATGFKGS